MDAAPSTPVLPPGTAVEVWTSFARTWASGFEVVDAELNGYYVRRGDGTVLPGVIPPQRVRPASPGTWTTGAW